MFESIFSIIANGYDSVLQNYRKKISHFLCIVLIFLFRLPNNIPCSKIRCIFLTKSHMYLYVCSKPKTSNRPKYVKTWIEKTPIHTHNCECIAHNTASQLKLLSISCDVCVLYASFCCSLSLYYCCFRVDGESLFVFAL